MSMEKMLFRSAFTGKETLDIGFALPKNHVLRNTLLKIPTVSNGYFKSVRFCGVDGELSKKLSNAFQMDFADGTDAFFVDSTSEDIAIYSQNMRGHIYGAYELVKQAQETGGKLKQGQFYCKPRIAFRGLKIYMPSMEELDNFADLLSMLAYFRYNKLIIEVGGAMEYKKHPEINSAWISYCDDMGQYPERAVEIQRKYGFEKDSIHFENGGGRFLTQDIVRKLIADCAVYGIEVIPEVPTLSHSDYLLNPHMELAERTNDPYPDTYCPSNPKTYELVFDVLDEVIDVFHPTIVHIGHDEYYSIGICDRCKGKSGAQIYSDDVIKIHGYLKSKGIRTMLWAEKLLNSIGRQGENFGGAEERYLTPDGELVIERPSTYESMSMVPKDIIAHHWYWGIRESYDDQYKNNGIDIIFGNFSSSVFPCFDRRSKEGVLGASLSNWSSLSKEVLQQNEVLTDLAYGACQFWSESLTEKEYTKTLKDCFNELYLYRNREIIEHSHFEIIHTTSILRPYEFISSVPLLLDKSTIGKYDICYDDGTQVSIPIIYNQNITNMDRTWTRSICHNEIYKGDKLLTSVAYTTLPIQEADATYFKIAVKNPYPQKKVISFTVNKTSEDSGDIIVKSFAIRT